MGRKATPMRIVSFAPITLPEALVPEMVKSGKTELAAAAFTKVRRLNFDMTCSLQAVGMILDLQEAGASREAVALADYVGCITTHPFREVQHWPAFFDFLASAA